MALARRTDSFGMWFASLGENYDHPTHIIRVNSRAKRVRRRKAGRWQYAKPKNLVAINVGYDDDFDCLDLDTWDPAPREYQLRYWAPSVETVAIGDSFPDYLERLLMGPAMARR